MRAKIIEIDSSWKHQSIFENAGVIRVFSRGNLRKKQRMKGIV